MDTEALVDALHAGHVRAALDVTDPEPLPEVPLVPSQSLRCSGVEHAAHMRHRELPFTCMHCRSGIMVAMYAHCFANKFLIAMISTCSLTPDQCMLLPFIGLQIPDYASKFLAVQTESRERLATWIPWTRCMSLVLGARGMPCGGRRASS